jgi:GalNAc-alpha-(1->4)-GalNAc-alpha-(1->3)-diNAcBac-PP-undecaprenol alpha-1,4-N-acetyl-D-galactosaminyltransferase
VEIACIIHSLDGGGAERVMAGLASRLSRRSHQVTLITLDDATGGRHPVDASVARLPLDLMGESRGLWKKLVNTRHRVRVVAKAVDDLAPEVVLSFCDRTNILVLQATRGRKVPVVIGERSDPAKQQLGAFWEYQRRRTYRRADRIVALTDSSAATLQPLNEHRVEVIASAVDPPPRPSDRVAAAAKRRILGAGRLEYEKGFDRLIESFAIIAKDHPEWTLRILGEGSQRAALEQLARQLGVSDRVDLPGWVRPIWDQLSDATLFALPSRYEGFPSALLEAMSVGLPSVAVDCESGPRSIITHETDGLLVTDVPQALADGISRMINDPLRREQWGQRGMSVVNRFSWERMVDRYEAVLQEVVGSASHPLPSRLREGRTQGKRPGRAVQ